LAIAIRRVGSQAMSKQASHLIRDTTREDALLNKPRPDGIVIEFVFADHARCLIDKWFQAFRASTAFHL
jgi:hypothetical protein